MDDTASQSGWPSPPPIVNAWWVTGELICGPYPGHQIPDTATTRLNALLDARVRLIVSLMENGERNWEGLLFIPYAPRLLELANERGAPIFRGQFPVRDLGVPTIEQVREILAAIRETATAGGVTYVHCFGGHGRSAIIAGCFLVEQGLSGPEALAAIGNLRRLSNVTPLRTSPETEAQRAFVRDWRG